MEKIAQIPQDVYNAFENSSPQYLVIGIRKSRAQNGEIVFQNVSFHVASKEELLTGIVTEKLHRHKAFEVKGQFSTEGELKQEAEKYKEEKIKEQELSELARLKAKYESKMEVVK